MQFLPLPLGKKMVPVSQACLPLGVWKGECTKELTFDIGGAAKIA